MSQLLKIISLRQHGIVFNNAFDGLLAGFNVGHSARIPTVIAFVNKLLWASASTLLKMFMIFQMFGDMPHNLFQVRLKLSRALFVDMHPILQYNLVL